MVVRIVLLACVAALLAFRASPASASFKCTKTPDPPYEMNECWYKDPHGKFWVVSGRTELPWSKKFNPVWWFGNDFEPTAPSWYLPHDRNRLLKWYLRNPLQNAGNYVFGVKDLNYTVRWVRGPPAVTNYADLNRTGCIYTVLDNSHGGNLWFPRTYISCTDNYVTWYAGTQWTGFFGFKFNVLNAKFQLF